MSARKMPSRAFKIVVWGATGFTGGLVSEYLSKHFDGLWAIAGRSEGKLLALQEQLEGMEDASSPTGMILADCDDDLSMRKMCAQAEVLVACVGPYRFWGEAAVQACIAERTKYVDVNGEPEFFTRMMLDHGDQAKKSGVPFLICAGMDSIPGDLGTQLILEEAKHEGLHDVELVECIVEVPPGQKINLGTWESLVHSFGNVQQLRRLRKKVARKEQLDQGNVEETKPGKKKKPLEKKRMDWKPAPIHMWSVPLPVADATVVRLSKKQGAFPSHAQHTRYFHQLGIRSRWTALYLFVLFFILRWFAPSKWARKFLVKHPLPPFKKLSRKNVGTARGTGKAWFIAKQGSQHVTGELILGDLYWFTAAAACESAMHLADQRTTEPRRCGFVTPATGLGVEFMHERLLKHERTGCSWIHHP